MNTHDLHITSQSMKTGYHTSLEMERTDDINFLLNTIFDDRSIGIVHISTRHGDYYTISAPLPSGERMVTLHNLTYQSTDSVQFTTHPDYIGFLLAPIMERDFTALV